MKCRIGSVKTFTCPTISFPADNLEKAVAEHMAQILEDTGHFDKIEERILGHERKKTEELHKEQKSSKQSLLA